LPLAHIHALLKSSSLCTFYLWQIARATLTRYPRAMTSRLDPPLGIQKKSRFAIDTTIQKQVASVGVAPVRYRYTTLSTLCKLPRNTTCSRFPFVRKLLRVSRSRSSVRVNVGQQNAPASDSDWSRRNDRIQGRRDARVGRYLTGRSPTQEAITQRGSHNAKPETLVP
jgi:hypothetical protein